MNVESLVKVKPNPNIPDLAPGDTVKVSARIVEGGKERIQVFQGVVIRLRRGGAGASFTVRHISYGIGVERTFPFYSPRVEKVEIVRHGKVRRAKLYYLRERSGKSARLKERRNVRTRKRAEEAVPEAELIEEPVPETEQVTEPSLEAEQPKEIVQDPVAEQEAEPVAEPALEEKPAAENALEAEPARETEEGQETDRESTSG